MMNLTELKETEKLQVLNLHGRYIIWTSTVHLFSIKLPFCQTVQLIQRHGD